MNVTSFTSCLVVVASSKFSFTHPTHQSEIYYRNISLDLRHPNKKAIRFMGQYLKRADAISAAGCWSDATDLPPFFSSGLDEYNFQPFSSLPHNPYHPQNTMETPRMRPMMPRFPSSRGGPLPYPHYFPIHPSFFPPTWSAPYPSMRFIPPPQAYLALKAPGDGEDGQAEAGPSTISRALIKLPPPTRRDTPIEYPTPPADDPGEPWRSRC